MSANWGNLVINLFVYYLSQVYANLIFTPELTEYYIVIYINVALLLSSSGFGLSDWLTRL
jgi:hypothetical protein